MSNTAASRQPLPFWLSPAGLTVIVLALTLLRIITGMNVGLVEDEAYYRIWGLNPAAGYYDHPPMVGWWIWIGQALAGDTALGVRLLSILSATIGSLALWRTASNLFDKRIAGWSVLFLNASILVGVGALISTPDAPSVFFWGLALWSMAELVRSQNANWWLLVGIFAGFGLLSKYSVLFLGAGIVLWLLWVPEARRWFASWQLWIGGLLAIAVFSPTLYWNYVHEWASFVKQFGRAVPEGYTLKYIGEFIGAVAGLLNPLIFILVLFGIGPIFKKTWKRDQVASLLLLTIVPFLIYLSAHSLHSRVQGNWPAPIFPTFAMIAAYGLVHASDKWQRFCHRLGVGGVILGFLVTALVCVHAYSPLIEGLKRKDPTHQLRGWAPIAQKVEELAKENGINWVATTSYAVTGQMSDQLKDTPLKVRQLNERERYLMVPKDTPLASDDSIYVVEERRDRSKQLLDSFEIVEPLASMPRLSGGSPIETVNIYRVSRPRNEQGYDGIPLR
ncbi:glycosyltransferase family 39 protein [Rhodobacteraceae bacterium RKSG542]|nr:glycosyltransferase family 39 protein [Pseudovibrio flavus]MTI18588.1 glycosyltransferase family 39 protein [Pseudovibrio flavus]